MIIDQRLNGPLADLADALTSTSNRHELSLARGGILSAVGQRLSKCATP
jgi:hypothetical protein